MLTIDLIKDVLTRNVDRVLAIIQLPIFSGKSKLYCHRICDFLQMFWYLFCCFFHPEKQLYVRLLFIKYSFFVMMSFILMSSSKSKLFWVINFFRIWVFIGVIFMLINGIFEILNPQNSSSHFNNYHPTKIHYLCKNLLFMSRERNSGKSNNRNSERRPSSPKSSKPSFDKPKRTRGTDTQKEVARKLLILEKNM